MCAKRLAEELNEGFIEDYSTPSKKPRTEQLDSWKKLTILPKRMKQRTKKMN